MYNTRTYYTLRRCVGLDEEMYDKEFDTYDEAYDTMCRLYINQKNDTPKKRYSIYRTTDTVMDGRQYVATMPAWS